MSIYQYIYLSEKVSIIYLIMYLSPLSLSGKWIYKLHSISHTVFPGGNLDYREKRTICVKTHKYDTGHVRQFEGVILLIRNPYRAIVAEVFRRQLFESNVSPEKAVRYFKSQGLKLEIHFLNAIKNLRKNIVSQSVDKSSINYYLGIFTLKCCTLTY